MDKQPSPIQPLPSRPDDQPDTLLDRQTRLLEQQVAMLIRINRQLNLASEDRKQAQVILGTAIGALILATVWVGWYLVSISSGTYSSRRPTVEVKGLAEAKNTG